MKDEISSAGNLIKIIEDSRNNALKRVNEELIQMYWKVGEYLSKEAESAAFGDAYIDSVVKEIQEAFPGIKGFNRRGLYRMKKFYETYCDDEFVTTLLTQIRDSDTVSNEIQNNLSLHGYKYIDLKPKEKRSGNLRRYDVGSVAEINGLNNEQYFILGLTYFDNELRAHVEKIDYIKAIASLVKYISERSQGFSTYMPVIGTGGADAGSVNDLVVYIVKTIELFKDEIDCDIHIVVSDKEEKLGLMNLKML